MIHFSETMACVKGEWWGRLEQNGSMRGAPLTISTNGTSIIQ